jgi:hypothetical protein
MDSLDQSRHPAGGRRLVESRLCGDNLHLDSGHSRIGEPKLVMEREGAAELRARLLRMILRNEQLRKSHVSSTTIIHSHLDA